MLDLKAQTEVAVLLSFGREFHNMLPRKDKLSLPQVVVSVGGSINRFFDLKI